MEETKSHLLAGLALIDKNLDELEEEFGDLPIKVEEKRKMAEELKSRVKETEQILEDVKEFCAVTKTTLVDLKDKEEKLSKQQFKVRNNKEFDAITSEIKHVSEEHKMLTEKFRQESIKQENLTSILEEQKEEAETAEKELKELEKELKEVSAEQEEERKEYFEAREKIVKKVDEKVMAEYDKIREYHGDAAVNVRRNSCTGCYSAIPAQIIVEMRNDLDTVYYCENCGRILIPEEVELDDSVVEEI